MAYGGVFIFLLSYLLHMQLSQQLFQLVKSLNAPEKGYLKKYVLTKTGSGKKYLQLFQILDSLAVYDDKVVKKGMQKAGTAGNLTNIKRYLLDSITHGLSDYTLKDTPETQVSRQLESVHVLLKKKLYPLCHDQLDKAEKLSIKYNLFTQQLDILNWRYRLAIREGDYTLLDDLTNRFYHKTVEKNLKHLDEKWQLLAVHGRLTSLASDRSEMEPSQVQKRIEPLIKEMPVFEHQQTEVFSHKLLLNAILSSYYNRTGFYDQAFEYSQRSVQLYLDDPDMIESSGVRNYMSVLVNFANRCLLVDRYDVMQQQIELVAQLLDRKDVQQNPDLKTTVKAYLYELRLLHLHNTQQYADVAAMRDELLQFIDKNRSALRAENLVLYYYYLMNCLYQNGQVEQAYEYCRFLIDEYKDNARQDLILSGYLVLFQLHYDMRHYQLLPHVIKNINYYMKSRRIDFESAKQLVKFYKQVVRSIPQLPDSATTDVFLKTWETLAQDPYNSTLTDTVNVPAWISRLNT